MTDRPEERRNENPQDREDDGDQPQTKGMMLLLPISEAPVVFGEEYGPCLLDLGTRWKLGYWNDEGWYTLEGDPASPLRFALLPSPCNKG